VTPFDLAHRLVGEIRELPGGDHHPYIQWCHMLVGLGTETSDETPWCSSFLNEIMWRLRLPRSKSAAARSWLTVGMAVDLEQATVGYDVVVLKRGSGAQPGPTVLSAPGHVGLFAGMRGGTHLEVLGGNQDNTVSIVSSPVTQVLGIRRVGLIGG
jgi:uncharacterized protein (TIGR02594 family)